MDSADRLQESVSALAHGTASARYYHRSLHVLPSATLSDIWFESDRDGRQRSTYVTASAACLSPTTSVGWISPLVRPAASVSLNLKPSLAPNLNSFASDDPSASDQCFVRPGSALMTVGSRLGAPAADVADDLVHSSPFRTSGIEMEAEAPPAAASPAQARLDPLCQLRLWTFSPSVPPVWNAATTELIYSSEGSMVSCAFGAGGSRRTLCDFPNETVVSTTLANYANLLCVVGATSTRTFGSGAVEREPHVAAIVLHVVEARTGCELQQCVLHELLAPSSHHNDIVRAVVDPQGSQLAVTISTGSEGSHTVHVFCVHLSTTLGRGGAAVSAGAVSYASATAGPQNLASGSDRIVRVTSVASTVFPSAKPITNAIWVPGDGAAGAFVTCAGNVLQVWALHESSTGTYGAAASRPTLACKQVTGSSCTVEYTCLAFPGSGLHPLDLKAALTADHVHRPRAQWRRPRLFAGTASGAVHQIDLTTMKVEGTFRLHNSRVTSIALLPNSALPTYQGRDTTARGDGDQGFVCATGSAEGSIRAWTSDFCRCIWQMQLDAGRAVATVTPLVGVSDFSIAVICCDDRNNRGEYVLASAAVGSRFSTMATITRSLSRPVVAATNVLSAGNGAAEKMFAVVDEDSVLRLWPRSNIADESQVDAVPTIQLRSSSRPTCVAAFRIRRRCVADVGRDSTLDTIGFDPVQAWKQAFAMRERRLGISRAALATDRTLHDLTNRDHWHAPAQHNKVFAVAVGFEDGGILLSTFHVCNDGHFRLQHHPPARRVQTSHVTAAIAASSLRAPASPIAAMLAVEYRYRWHIITASSDGHIGVYRYADDGLQDGGAGASSALTLIAEAVCVPDEAAHVGAPMASTFGSAHLSALACGEIVTIAFRAATRSSELAGTAYSGAANIRLSSILSPSSASSRTLHRVTLE